MIISVGFHAISDVGECDVILSVECYLLASIAGVSDGVVCLKIVSFCKIKNFRLNCVATHITAFHGVVQQSESYVETISEAIVGVD